jgi:hypothetical protein
LAGIERCLVLEHQGTELRRDQKTVGNKGPNR